MFRLGLYIAKRFFMVFFTGGLLVITGCKNVVNLESQWRTDDLVLDGNKEDWNYDFYDFQICSSLIGIKNDSNNIYLCFITGDQKLQRQIQKSGFQLSFDPSGGTKGKILLQCMNDTARLIRENLTDKDFSNRMPMQRNGEMDNVDFPGPQPFPYNIGPVNGDLPSVSNAANREFSQYFPDGEMKDRLPGGPGTSILLKSRIVKKELIYEMTIPLRQAGLISFDLSSSKKRKSLGIGIIVGVSGNSMKKPGDFQGGGPGGKMGRPSGNGGPGGSMGGPDGGPGGMDSIEFEEWMIVTLVQQETN